MKPEAGRQAELHRSRRQQGTVLMLMVVGMLGMLAVAALATDVGHVWAARTELQASNDSAALAGAANLYDPTTQSVTLGAATAAVQSYANANDADQKTVNVPPANITFGNWILATRTFDPSVDLTNPNLVTAVQVNTDLATGGNGPVRTVLSNVLGRDRFDIGASAIGYLGFVGNFPPGTVDLPIALDCCAISGGSTCGDYCTWLRTNKPNPFTVSGSGHITPTPTGGCASIPDNSCVTKLEFESTPQQNACYTDFQSDPNVNTPDLVGIVRNANNQDFGVDSGGVNLDNGDKTPVLKTVRDKFYGLGEFSGNPAGTLPPRYGTVPTPPKNPSGVDSWVVSLPVVACQSGDKCAGGSPAQVVGAVCLEVRRVDAPGGSAGTAAKEIFGRLFCPGPSEPLDCGIDGAGPGGKPGTIRAERAVLVQ